MATTNITGNETQTKTFEGPECFSIRVAEFKQQSVSFSAANIFLSILATLGNSLILVALHKVSSLRPPSKVLYRCLATTDLLIGFITQPLYATYWISLVHEHWSLCRYSLSATSVTGYVLCLVSLLTLTAISVDRLLALLLIQRDCDFEAHVYHFSYLLVYISIRWFILTSQLHYNHLVQLYNFIILLSYLHCLIHKDFPRSQSSSGSNTRSCSTTAKPTKCIKHGAIQKGSVQCTVGTVSFSCLLCTTHCSQNCVVS